MKCREAIKMMYISAGMSQHEFGAQMGLTPANTSKLLKKEDFRIEKDLRRYADICGYTVKVVLTKCDTGDKITIDE